MFAKSACTSFENFLRQTGCHTLFYNHGAMLLKKICKCWLLYVINDIIVCKGETDKSLMTKISINYQNPLS